MPNKDYEPISPSNPLPFERFTPSLKISQKALDDLTKKVEDLTKAFELLSEQFKLVFGDHALINGQFVNIKDIKGPNK